MGTYRHRIQTVDYRIENIPQSHRTVKIIFGNIVSRRGHITEIFDYGYIITVFELGITVTRKSELLGNLFDENFDFINPISL